VANDQQTSLALDPTTVSLVIPAGATNIVTDADGDVIGLTVPGEGSWSVDPATGEVTFVPDPALNGDPTPVFYTVKETGGDVSNQAELRVSYVNAAIFPVAVDDTLVVNHYGGNSGTVVTNDQLGTGTQAQHTWTLVTPPQHGTVEFNSDGTYTYYPEANYNGPDSFEYMITDAAARTSIATVSINVDCASSQTSDGGNALGFVGILIMMLMIAFAGLYTLREETKGNE
jgi:CshA-type fibril repeat protein